MSAAVLDHLVVAAPTLDAGVAWCQHTLGVMPEAGGKHPLMGTHNRVVNIGSDAWPNAYLEIIAIDPDAPPPGRARWFALDDAALQARLARHGPQLVHWVVRSTMLDMHRWGLVTVGQPPGEPVAASRDTPHGRLSWQITVPADGSLRCGGALPTLIQWQGSFHPAERLPPSGATLQAFTAAGVPPRARDVLRMRGVRWAEGEPALTAVLQAPAGAVTLTSEATA